MTEDNRKISKITSTRRDHNDNEISCVPPKNISPLSWSQKMRELRHNQCLMTPLTALMFFLMSTLMLAGLVLQLPGFIIGLMVGPMMIRGNWFVEFLYPSSVAKWGHLLLLRWGSINKNVALQHPHGSDDKNKGSNKKKKLSIPVHSRAIEQRTEVVKGRVYVHSLPQLLDNIGYLIVSLPEPARGGKKQDPIVAVLVDCGDADSVIDQIDLISDVHYSDLPNNNIEVQTLLCTHKHHDHTAGNKKLMSSRVCGKNLKIYGGAVENVPYCNHFVTNGDLISLPVSGTNDMNSEVEIECIAVPSHTRGSIVYALRTKEDSYSLDDDGNASTISHLFTGDAMFSGGGGVPFEADLEFPADKKTRNMMSYSPFKPGAGVYSIERCFAEVLVRALGDASAFASSSSYSALTDKMLVFPGHEYTIDLLQRQFDPSNEYIGQWSRFEPSVFFEVAHQYFISSHRRYLPKAHRLLTVPTSITREFKINPHFRSLKKRGEHLTTAVKTWYKYGARKGSIQSVGSPKIGNALTRMKPSSSSRGLVPVTNNSFDSDSLRRQSSSLLEKSLSSESTWNLNQNDLNKSVFTTVYSSDMDFVVDALKNGKISSSEAARELSGMTKKMENPTVTRRPVPGTLPTEKSMFLGLIALSVLGSAPSGMTMGDSAVMNLAKPVDTSDHLCISKNRLLLVLMQLGLIPPDSSTDTKGYEIVQMIHLLWKEARLDENDLELAEEDATISGTVSDSTKSRKIHRKEKKMSSNSLDLEVQKLTENPDLIELGVLKLTLYSVTYNQQSWFAKTCLPCCSSNITETVPGRKGKMKRSSAELVRHDTSTCPMCRDVIGCPVHAPSDNERFDELNRGSNSFGSLQQFSNESGNSNLHSSTLVVENQNDVEMEVVKA